MGVSFALGTLFSMCLLFQYKDNSVAISILNFGNWISGMAGLSGFVPALITSSLLAGLLTMCVISSITPVLEEYVTKKGMNRSKRTLPQEEKMSIEEERKLFVERFGQVESN